jgi:hypothetical protein
MNQSNISLGKEEEKYRGKKEDLHTHRKSNIGDETGILSPRSKLLGFLTPCPYKPNKNA